LHQGGTWLDSAPIIDLVGFFTLSQDVANFFLELPVLYQQAYLFCIESLQLGLRSLLRKVGTHFILYRVRA